MEEFKIGDKVERIGEKNTGGVTFHPGEVGVVTKVRKDGHVDVRIDGKGVCYANNPRYLKLARPGTKNYRVRCVGYNRDERYFTVGKVYDVVNGRIKNDNGFEYTERGGEDAIEWLSGWYKFERVEGHHKIVITTDGKTTTALLFEGKKMIRKAEAKCSPEDEFDFMVGAELAMERLNPKPKFEVGQYVKVTGNKHYGQGLAIGSIGLIRMVTDETHISVNGFDSNDRGIHQTLHPDDFEVLEF